MKTRKKGFIISILKIIRIFIFYLTGFLNLFKFRLNICLDITVLETIREVFFIGLMVYSQIVILRIAISWFIYINPYTVPWCYILLPLSIGPKMFSKELYRLYLGVNITGSVFLGDSWSYGRQFKSPSISLCHFFQVKEKRQKLLINE
jgi:hypothetical protein